MTIDRFSETFTFRSSSTPTPAPHPLSTLSPSESRSPRRGNLSCWLPHPALICLHTDSPGTRWKASHPANWWATQGLLCETGKQKHSYSPHSLLFSHPPCDVTPTVSVGAKDSVFSRGCKVLQMPNGSQFSCARENWGWDQLIVLLN